MELDLQLQLDSVKRSVGSAERDGQPTRSVSLSRSLDATSDELWTALTDAERIGRWFTPISGQLKLGGRFQLQYNASGTITDCDPGSYFASTWEFAGDVSWLEVNLGLDQDQQVQLTLTHTSLVTEHWDTYGAGAAGVGWELGLLWLTMHLKQPDTPLPDETEFATSAAGRDFISGSSSGWTQAAILAGGDPQAAHAAEARTTSFYTGESAEPA